MDEARGSVNFSCSKIMIYCGSPQPRKLKKLQFWKRLGARRVCETDVGHLENKNIMVILQQVEF